MGNIKVTIQTEDRLKAINNLSQAVSDVAKALLVGTHVEVSNCTFNNAETGIVIDTADDVTENTVTELKE